MTTQNSLRSTGGRSNLLPVDKPIREWTFDDGLGLIDSSLSDGPTARGYLANRRYIVDRDHWQNGDPWVGPRGSPETEQLVLDGVQPQFTPVDVINECLDTLRNALLERRPTTTFGLREAAEPGSDTEKAAQKRSALVMRRLLEWADKRQLWQLLGTVVRRSAYATWGTMRAYVPTNRLTRTESTPEGEDEGATPVVTYSFPTGLSLEEALDSIHVTAPDPEACVVWSDPETRERVAVFFYRYAEKDYIELWWVDRERGTTYVRTLCAGMEPQEVALELGKRLPVVQLSGDLLITESVRRQQARLNFFESLMVRVGETSGFPERYTTNAKPTGIWLTVPPSDGPALEMVEEGSTVWYLHPTPRTLGAAVTTDLVGVQDDVLVNGERTGGKTTLTPGVIFREPTNPEFAIDSAAHAKQTIREECHQGHIGMDGDATSTGWSRVQARTSFISDVTARKGPLEAMLAELFEVVLAYAGQMTTELGDFLELFRCVVVAHISPGPVDPAERTAVLEQVKAGLLSMESALTMLNVADVRAEMDRLEHEPAAKMVRLGAQFDLVGKLTLAGLQLDTACTIAGVAPEHLTLIKADVVRIRAELAAEDEDEEREGGGGGEKPPAGRPAPRGIAA